MIPRSREQTPEQRRRREVRHRIMLPMAGMLVLMVGMILLFVLVAGSSQFAATADVPFGTQVGVVSDFLLTIFVLLPVALMCLIPTIILMAAAIGLWKLNNVMVQPMGQGRRAVIRQLDRVTEVVPRLAAPVIKMQGGLGSLERMMIRHPASEQPSPEEEEQSYGN